MVDKDYVKTFNSLSEEFSKDAIFSMAAVGKLHNLNLDKDNFVPYYQDKKEVGRVQLPEDFSNLLSVPGIEVHIWYSDNASSRGIGREHAFTLHIVGYDEVKGIDVLYGVSSRVQKIIIYGWDFDKDRFKCRVPAGFSLADLTKLLNEGSLKDFVLDNSTNLSQSQRNVIIKYGLC